MDIDRRWSTALPLEKELQPFHVLDFEPVSEHARRLFRSYREVREKVIEHYAKSSQKRADLANRFRRSRHLEPGQKVVYRDPRASKAGGRTPWRKPLEPCTLESVSGNRAVLRREDGTSVEAHVEDVVVVPSGAQDLEVGTPDKPLQLLDNAEPLELGDRRSVGQMLEADEPRAEQPARCKPSRGKLDKVSPGQFIAYAPNKRSAKRCRIGKVRIILRAEAEMVVHRYRPLSEGRLRVSWRPVFRSASGETLDAGEEPSTESVRAQDVILIVQLHDGGVLSHAAARSLDKAGWRLDETDMEFEADLVHGPSDQSAARLEALVVAVQGGLLALPGWALRVGGPAAPRITGPRGVPSAGWDREPPAALLPVRVGRVTECMASRPSCGLRRGLQWVRRAQPPSCAVGPEGC